MLSTRGSVRVKTRQCERGPVSRLLLLHDEHDLRSTIRVAGAAASGLPLLTTIVSKDRKSRSYLPEVSFLIQQGH